LEPELRKVVLWILPAVLALLLTTAAWSQEVFDEGNGWFATRDLRANTSMPQAGTLRIESVSTLVGSISITTSREPTVAIIYRKKARTSQLSRAIDIIDRIAFTIDNSAKGARLQFRAPNPPPWNQQVESGRVEIEITMPESCAVVISAVYFDVEADGPFTEFRVPTSYGGLRVSNVDGALELQTANRRLIADRIRGRIQLKTSNSTLTASDLHCPDAQARIQNEGGDIRIDRLHGQLNIKNSYGRIEISDFHPIGTRNFIRGLSGPVFIDIGQLGDARLVVNNRYEDIEVTIPQSTSSSLSLAVEEDGRIEVSNLLFTSDLVEHNRLNLIAGEGAATVSATVRGNGNIYVRGRDKGDR
jgi:hypothetical protein